MNILQVSTLFRSVAVRSPQGEDAQADSKISLPNSDRIGMMSAILCLIHCLITPILFVLSNDYFKVWEWMEFAFLGVGFWAVRHASRHMHSAHLKYLLWMCLCLLFVCIFFEGQFPFSNYTSYGASIGLVALHGVNFNQQKKKTLSSVKKCC